MTRRRSDAPSSAFAHPGGRQFMAKHGVNARPVEVAVNRLRAKLGPAAAALETTNRRGYRLAVA